MIPLIALGQDAVLPPETPWHVVILFTIITAILGVIKKAVDTRIEQTRKEYEKQFAQLKTELKREEAQLTSIQRLFEGQQDLSNVITELTKVIAAANLQALKEREMSLAEASERSQLLRQLSDSYVEILESSKRIESDAEKIYRLLETIQHDINSTTTLAEIKILLDALLVSIQKIIIEALREQEIKNP